MAHRRARRALRPPRARHPRDGEVSPARRDHSRFGLLIAPARLRQMRVAAATGFAHETQRLLTEGRYDEARARIDAVPPGARRGMFGIVVLVQRAALHFVEGEMVEAAATYARALTLRTPLIRGLARAHLALQIRAFRAVALAAAGDGDAARAEADGIDAAPQALPAHRGHAALARAITFARLDQRAELAAELARARTLFDEMTGREAALARTLARVAASPAAGAYRTPAVRGTEERSALGAWVVKVLPNAAPFAPRRQTRAPTPDLASLPSPSEATRARVAAARAQAVRAIGDRARWEGIALLVSIVALSVVGMLAALGRAEPVVAWSLFAGVVAMVAAMTIRDRRLTRALQEAGARFAEGAVDDADARLARIARATPHALASLAHMNRALIAERRDDLDGALAHLDAALGRALKNPSVEASLRGRHLPSIVGLRARVLAAMGRTDDALAELELLARAYPGYASATDAASLPRIIVALRLGQRDLARDLAAARGDDAPTPRHGEILVALLLGEAGQYEAEGDRERIEADLASQPALRSWIARIAPGLVRPMRTSTGVRVADDDAGDDATGDADDDVHGAHVEGTPARATH
ncbi:MAG: hypothetical protein U0325_01895 [Polyangiales bacterium]